MDTRTIEMVVYNYLCDNHTGKDNKVKNQELRRIFGVSGDKMMRKIIQNIREDKQFTQLVGSVSGSNGGYFICENEDEITETINNTRHRANQMLRSCHIMEWKGKISASNL